MVAIGERTVGAKLGTHVGWGFGMEFWHGFIVITCVHLLAAASPGPDFVYVSQQALVNGKRAGVLASLGIALGLSLHIVYSAFGLATLVAHSAPVLTAIKIVGGCYLIYLGAKGLASRRAVDSAAMAPAEFLSSRRCIGRGFLCNALNPKAPIYFVSLFTIVLSPDMPGYQIAIYGLWMMLIQFVWFALLALFLAKPSVVGLLRRSGHWLDRFLGAAMIVLGLRILVAKGN